MTWRKNNDDDSAWPGDAAAAGAAINAANTVLAATASLTQNSMIICVIIKVTATYPKQYRTRNVDFNYHTQNEDP